MHKAFGHRFYKKFSADFKFNLPELFNIGIACADIPARVIGDKAAIIEIDNAGNSITTRFSELAEYSARLASALQDQGIAKGDRVAILLPQGAAVAIAHLAIYKLGAIAVPLAHVFQTDALAYRLDDSGASALISDTLGIVKLRSVLKKIPLLRLKLVLCTDYLANNEAQTNGFKLQNFAIFMEGGNPNFNPEVTKIEDPCLIIYTSGTTGQPKGTLHAQRILIGHLPGFELHHAPKTDASDTFRTDGIFWTPADWAWAGGLLNVLFPALYFGQTVIAWPYIKFDPQAAFTMMEKHHVTHAFIPPTALRMMRAADSPNKRTQLQSLTSAGEALGAEMYQWCMSELGVQVDEFYGQTECNYILGSCFARNISRAGAIGKAMPGAKIAVLNQNGLETLDDECGEIAIHRHHPSMFLEYWNQSDATKAKFKEDWMLTGDLAVRDADGYIAFIGRNDDVITSSGYRIGPVEIEDCLLRHPTVALAAVIGKPDALRTEIVKAFIVLKIGFAADDTLVEDIKLFVRGQLSAHEYPREISFVDNLPMTSTGKIIRKLLRENEILASNSKIA